MLASVVVLFLLNMAILSRLAVYRRDQPWNSRLNWAGEKRPRFANPLRTGRLEVFLASTYTTEAQRLLPWFWIAYIGFAAAAFRFLFSLADV